MRVHRRPTPDQATLKSIMVYDPETGSFTRACGRGRKWKAGSPMGTVACGYLSINIDRTIYRAHRLAWTYMTGQPPPDEIDHENGDPLDNRWCNLRESTHAENLANQPTKSSNTSGYKGVYEHKGRARRKRFQAFVMRDGKQHSLGYYLTAEEAKAARDAAAKVLHGDFFRP